MLVKLTGLNTFILGSIKFKEELINRLLVGKVKVCLNQGRSNLLIDIRNSFRDA